MLHILAQYDVEVAWSGDQDVVEAFAAEGADEAFGNRVRPRCPDRGADDADVGGGKNSVERGCELAVPVLEPHKLREPGAGPSSVAARFPIMVRGCCWRW